ncbi:SCP2 sterol-binding domain-containing protein [Acidiferrimicrobium sp. IK]|uniref:SCP2 sterol-binding domain-containing protein n=1 Tax=Acidiferrimicrobium sp. IK TaxID=2871700 RepID=UPI0021CB26CF|nr:SCP2 sterol-binding domain-containing protein [Acidiferrimicrobium sp. IK]MCU4184155.1 SCP2 sterol-binding domain-containing protein [Acidiferrimicrobium sp. IK]
MGEDQAGDTVAPLDEQLQAAFGALIEGATLGASDLSGALALVVPASAGRPRRTRSAPPAGTEGSGAAAETAQGTLEIEGGRVVRWIPGVVAPDAVATLTLPLADARALLAGVEEPSVLFMQGRLKADGDMAAILALLRATAGDGYGRGRATLAASDGR